MKYVVLNDEISQIVIFLLLFKINLETNKTNVALMDPLFPPHPTPK
jgi:hypothetical protein